MKNKLIALLMAALLLAGITASAGAQAQKDEVVYARLAFDGKVQEVIVINAFEADSETDVTDFGAYNQAKPLSAAKGFDYQDGAAKFTMGKGRFSYQGLATDTALPWTINLAYALNGKPITQEELSGNSGLLDGKLSVQVNEAMKATAQALSLQITITLNGDQAFDIKADKATHAIAGGMRTLSFVVLPGQSADYTFQAQVHDFSMPDIQIAGIKMGMDNDMYQQVARDALAGNPLQDAVGGIMGNFLSTMGGGQPNSFSDSRNSIRSLQFILFVDGVKTPAPAAVDEVVHVEQNVWQRLLALFGL